MSTSAYNLKQEAAQELADLCTDVWFDLAERFTCQEAEAVANFLRKWTRWGDGAAIADNFLAAHGDGDEPDDDHYREED